MFNFYIPFADKKKELFYCQKCKKKVVNALNILEHAIVVHDDKEAALILQSILYEIGSDA